MADKRHQDAVRRYDAVNTKPVYLKLNLKTDADVLQRLDAIGNKQGYIKYLIRKDINDKRQSTAEVEG